jgi:hypothetical protein
MKFDMILKENNLKPLDEANLSDLAKDNMTLNSFILRASQLLKNEKIFDTFIHNHINDMKDLTSENLKKYIPIIKQKLNNQVHIDIINKLILAANQKLKEKASQEVDIAQKKEKAQQIRDNELIYNNIIYNK